MSNPFTSRALSADKPQPFVTPPEPPYVTGGPPFPRYPTDDGKFGISILDYFAAHVMAGLAMRADMTIDDLKATGPQEAYWIAALMVGLRGQLEVETTPPPTEPLTEPDEPVGPPPLTIDSYTPMIGGLQKETTVTLG